MISFSVIAVASVSLQALFLCLLSTVLAYLSGKVFKRNNSKPIFFLFLLSQIVIMLLPSVLGFLESFSGQVVSLGIAYFSLKSISVTVDSYKFERSYAFFDVLILNLFFPVYSAGPIERVTTLSREQFSVDFDTEKFVEGLSRVFIGIFKFYYLAQSLILGFIQSNYPFETGLDPIAFSDAYVLILLKWCALYLFFSGYSDIAIGASRLFNIKIRENFNSPFLATNIQEYWQRWHMSLMNFMSEYVYLAFVRRTGARVLGIGLVFLAAGMWHHLSINYLLWGVMHALAMMSYLHYRKFVLNNSLMSKVSMSIYYSLLCRGVTLSFVFFVSAIGTAGSTDEALWITRSLFQI